MPPQAAPKSPPPSSFIAAVHGEWSDAMKSSTPAVRPSHRSSRLAASRTGGEHLNAVAPSPISSLQLGLPIVWTEARRRGVPLSQVVGWMARAPAEFAGLPAKGRIAPGFDADFCIFAPDESFVVDPRRLQHRHPVTPYAGRRLQGVVRSTMLRGEVVEGKRPRGRLLARHAA